MSKENYVNTNDAIAAYWTTPVTRQEVQKVFDDYTAATIQMQERLLKLDFAVSFLLEKTGAKPEEIAEFMDKKMGEFAADQVKAQDSKGAN